MIRRSLPWIMWAIPVTFCAFQFVLRQFPGLVKLDIMDQFSVDATAYGMFASAYYIGYASMQIPIAILLERIGPRVIIGGSALVCAFSCWLLASTTYWPLAIFSRFMIGVGSVVGFLGTTKIIVDWFHHDRQSRMIGITMSVGLLGAIYGGKPMSMLIRDFGWVDVLILLTGASALIAILAIILIRSPQKTKIRQEPIVGGLKKLLTNRSLLVIAAANLLMVGSLEGFADVWGVSYLQNAHKLDKESAAGISSIIFIGMMFGAPFLSWLAEKTNQHVKLTSLCGFLIAVTLGILLVGHSFIPLWGIKLIMFLLGILSSYQALVFVIGADLVPKHLSNIAIATLNSINMFGGVFFHSSIGYLMDIFWEGQFVDGHKFYSLATQSTALWVIPVSALIGGLMISMVSMPKVSGQRK